MRSHLGVRSKVVWGVYLYMTMKKCISLSNLLIVRTLREHRRRIEHQRQKKYDGFTPS